MKESNNVEVIMSTFWDETHQVQTGEFEYETIESYCAKISVKIDGVHAVINVSGNPDEPHAASFHYDDEQHAYDGEMDAQDVWAKLEAQGWENNYSSLSEKCECNL